MPTLMKQPTFEQLVEVRQRLVQDTLRTTMPRQEGPGGVFVPWAGRRLVEGRGIYFVGIALNADGVGKDMTFQESLAETEAFCNNGPHLRGHTPFWQFVNELTQGLLGGPYHKTAERWGWSNLLKIGWSDGKPSNWPADLKSAQRDVGSYALREEFAQLRDSLVFIGSFEEFGILRQILPGEDSWQKEHEKTAGIWFLFEPASGNLYVHGYHPSAARRRGFFDEAIDRTIRLTREWLPSFS